MALGLEAAGRLEDALREFEAVFARHTSYANAMALTALTVFLLGALVAGLGHERTGAVFAEGSG